MSASDVWVGSWRPHKPRGPIAALYSSPGPKYALPGATGVNDHDPRKWKAPAYSFGSRHRHFSPSCSPGPGYLVPSNITRIGHDGTPAYSLYSRLKDSQPFQTPAPGYIGFVLSVKKKNNRFFCSIVCSLSLWLLGPAAYMLPSLVGPNTVNKRSAPNFSLTGRTKKGSFYEDLQKTPGPGSYRVVDPSVYRSKPPQYSLTSRTSMPGDKTKKPGPGAHCPEQVTMTRPQAPRFSFGVPHSEFITQLIVDISD
uniref:Uncharacterized protein n=1 Tax=Electrophorus electricus TaxID=8005 RepID=A0AAY5EMK5_ELEEL